MKMIIPVELYIRDLYRVYVECDENTTNDQAAALARQMALCGDVDHTMLAADQEIEYDDVQIAFVDDEAAWTEEEEQEMKARITAMKPRRCDTITMEEQKSDLLYSYRIRANEIRQMLGDKYTTLNSYPAIFEKLGAARMIAIILRSDHGEPESEMEYDRLSAEVYEAFDAMQAKSKK